SLMKTSAEQNDQEQNFMPRDTTAQWLVTYGIVTKPSEVLTRRTIRSEEFSVPQSAFCIDADEDKKPSAGGNVLYCVNGQPLQADHAYSVVTTNHVAEDTLVYGVLAGLPSDYHEASDVFLVTKIGETISTDGNHLQKEGITTKNTPTRDIIQDEVGHQVRG